jgi:hypothetical protein
METDNQTSKTDKAFAMLGGEDATMEITLDPNAGNNGDEEANNERIATIKEPAKAEDEAPKVETKIETAGKTEPEIDYKAKFSASTTEAQRLVAENKLLEARMAEIEANAGRLAKEKEEMERRFADQNPEVYDQIKTSKEMAEIKEKLLLQEERTAIDDFTKTIPEAVSHKDALKKLGRAFPGKSYQDIWNETFKPFYDNIQTAVIEDKKKSMPEKGDGSISEVTTEELSLAEINKLSLPKQKAYFKKMGWAV